MRDPLDTVREFRAGAEASGRFHSLPELERAGFGGVSRLPVSLRVVLESVLRGLDGVRVTEDDVRALAGWRPVAERVREVPFGVSRVLLQDFTGVPLLVDLAALRSAVVRSGKAPEVVAPNVPVDLVVDHSVQVDYFAIPRALELNMEMELKRNKLRYQFLRWASQAFPSLRIVPPGVGICHQVNLEHLASVVVERDGVWFPDTLVGTDSHTTMVNGLGVVGWGVGGIEAEAAMLGEPIYMLMPDVVGVHMTGQLGGGATATDLVLHVTELLRRTGVVGKFVEFFGDGAASLGVPERATLANMAPEYGATIGYFPVDEETCRYLLATGRSPAQVAAVRSYFRAQGLFGIPREGQVDYSRVVPLDLGGVRPSVSGPRRPQERIPLPRLKARFLELLTAPLPGGFGRPEGEGERRWRAVSPSAAGRAGGGAQDPDTLVDGAARDTNTLTEREMMDNRPTPDRLDETSLLGTGPTAVEVGHGDILIAAITSCTNTSNPRLMIAAGLLARKASAAGLRVGPNVKTSLAPGSRVVSRYLEETGLDRSLDELGFRVVGYGCTTCIGNSGPIDPRLEALVGENGIVAASVLSGNRNFEARIHQSLKANFLMSPPLVVAFAIAGRVTVDLDREPLGRGLDGREVFLRDVWPTTAEVEALLAASHRPESYLSNYADLTAQNQEWNRIPAPAGKVYAWDPRSTYIQEPPFVLDLPAEPPSLRDIVGARCLALFGDGISTDHISPAGAIKPSSPAGEYLQREGVPPADFNSYGSRRGNHEVMVRGTFANVRIRNLLARGAEGGVTLYLPSGRIMSVHQAALEYRRARTPLVVIAGRDYGSGSSRDWAAKGTALLGVRAVIARSFERIHRSNLVMMGVLPCELSEEPGGFSLDGTEVFDVVGVARLAPRGSARLRIHRSGGRADEVALRVRIDTPMELDYYRHGGILPFIFRRLLRA